MSGASPAPPVTGPPGVLRMAAPLMVSFVMRAAFNLVDTAYAATIGDDAVAAIGLTAPFEFFMIAVWVGLSTGLTSGLSRAMGAHQGARVDQYVRACWRLVWTASPFFLALGVLIWLLAPRADLEPAVAEAFRIYGTVLIGGSAFTTFWSVIPDSLVKAHHDTRSTMWAGIWSNVINLALNTLFLFVFHWGVFGIALSTVLGRIGGLAYALARAERHEARRRAAGTDTDPGLDASPYRTILGLAVPSSLTFVLMALETAAINRLLAWLDNPTEAIAAYSIYFRVVMFAFNPVIATSVAMLPYSARRFGEGDVAGVRRGLRQASGAMSVYSILLVGPLMLFAAPQLARWLAENPVSERYTTFALRLVPLACFSGIPFLLCRPVFEGMGRGGPGLIAAAIRYLGLTVPLAGAGVWLARSADAPGMYGLLLGVLAAAALTSVFFWIWLRSALATYAAGAPTPEGGSS